MTRQAPGDWMRASAAPGMASSLWAAVKLAGFFGLTMPLMPVQAALIATWPAAARWLPCWYHRRVCRLLGVRVRIEGVPASGGPVLIIANHTSWLDIPVIGSVQPVSFVAKKEVGSWPFVAWLARLQRTVFVDRKRRSSIGTTADEMIGRLAAGDTLVLFAEGTSSDGNRVLPFKTSLLAAAKPPRAIGEAVTDVVVQTLAIAYTHVHGVPMGRADRSLTGWYGDMEMGSHAWELLCAGPIDVTVKLGVPVPLEQFSDRKALARHSEAEIRNAVVGLVRNGGKPGAPVEAAAITDKLAAGRRARTGADGRETSGRRLKCGPGHR